MYILEIYSRELAFPSDKLIRLWDTIVEALNKESRGISQILCNRYFQVKNRTKFYGVAAALSAAALSIT